MNGRFWWRAYLQMDLVTEARSSPSRWIEYRPASPLSPRPRRSAIAAAVPNGHSRVLDGQGHGDDVDVLIPVLTEFSIQAALDPMPTASSREREPAFHQPIPAP